jgi:flagellar secretion chaperone FliS
MFGTARSGANAYAKISVETGVTAASPHKLILMLFEGALMAITVAQEQMKSGDIAGKGLSISKACTIIEEGLRASLDKKAGGDIAINLDALYAYMNSQLTLAHVQNDIEKLEQVKILLRDLKGAWEAIDPTPTSAPAAEAVQPKAAAYDALAPRMAANFAKA